ncbi:MAG: Processive diacylglycerol beta-glucosyltransferase [Firmicutes bacterium ADurb.Bin456]|nr:MAG: Processive diacylglycerol beta-glucosyltransferase [Firmicutes bacterium ADurb.Bin456]
MGLPGCEIAVVCGNDKTRERMLKKSFSQSGKVHVFGFIEDIHELMNIACCVITKAGGITLSEAVAAQLPLVLFRPVPGQERDNALYLAWKKAAVVVNRTGEIHSQLKDILSNEKTISQMRASVRSLRRDRAGDTVVEDILHELEMGCKDKA